MKVSIITVTRNSATTLVEALRSVAEQSHPYVEHIVIDGASTDATDEVVKQHGTRVAKYLSEPDSGIYDAMNKGLSFASGDVVAFLNADDRYSDSGVLERIVAVMSQEGLDLSLIHI
jgi:glycosyltransferase involved in cell wall biosynthesis